MRLPPQPSLRSPVIYACIPYSRYQLANIAATSQPDDGLATQPDDGPPPPPDDGPVIVSEERGTPSKASAQAFKSCEPDRAATCNPDESCVMHS
eukprot:6187379-Pleurochrysis_carterae.AAC.2